MECNHPFLMPFVEHLEREYSAENIALYHAVRRFQKLCEFEHTSASGTGLSIDDEGSGMDIDTYHERSVMAREIYATYVASDAPYMVSAF